MTTTTLCIPSTTRTTRQDDGREIAGGGASDGEREISMASK